MLILLLCLMCAIDDLLWVLIDDPDNIFDERLFYLFFIPLFSKIILKQNIYKHQYFSLLISLIGFIFLIIPLCIAFRTKYILNNILNTLKGINLSLFIVLIKHVIEKYYISSLKICLIIGIVSIIINLIGYIIYCLIIKDFRLFTDCLDFSQVENKIVISIYFVLYFIFETLSQIALFLSIFYFYPTLIMVTYIINPILISIYSIISEETSTETSNESSTVEKIDKIGKILYPIGYIITLFSTLIYNELIIFNCCDLNKNTKKFVNKRIYKELEEIQKSEEIFTSENDFDSLVPDNNQ